MFYLKCRADVERLIGEGAVKTVKKPSVQKNKGAKPMVKKEKEEIKFDKYQAIIPNIDKPDEIQLKKIEEIKKEVAETTTISKPQIPASSPKVDQKKSLITKTNKMPIKKNVSPPIKKQVFIKQSIPVQQKQVSLAKPMPMKQVIASNQVLTTKQQTPQRHLIVARPATTKPTTPTNPSDVNKCINPIVKRVIATKPLVKSIPAKQATYVKNVASVKTPTLIKQVPPPKNTPFIRQVTPAKQIQTTKKTALIHQGKVVGIISQNVVTKKKESQITYIVPSKNEGYILGNLFNFRHLLFIVS